MRKLDFRNLELKVNITAWLREQGFKFQERSEELIADSCIHCSRSKKMYIDKEKGLFKCHVCETKGNAISLVMKVGGVSFKKAIEICYGITDEPIDTNNMPNWSKAFEDPNENEHSDEPPEPIDLPQWFHELTPQDTEAWEYLRKRGLSDDIISDIELYYWPDQKRVVFVMTAHDEVYGYMGRDITGLADPKTLNSRGNFRSFYFWNYDKMRVQQNLEELVICEGVFSAIKAGHHRSIAVLGKAVTKGQISLLRTLKPKKLIFGLDVGTEEEQDKLYETLSVYYPGKIYKIDFPPIVKLKEELNQSVLDEVNKRYKTSLKINSTTVVDRFPAGDKTVLEVSAKDKEVIKKVLKDTKLILVSPQALEFMKMVKKSDYIDAGDYSVEEMEEFVKKAKPYKKSGF